MRHYAMNITLKTFATIRDVVGGPERTVALTPGARLGDLLDTLTQIYGAPFDRQVRDQLTGHLVPFLILVNGTAFRSTQDLDHPLSEGDVVTFMIPFDGG